MNPLLWAARFISAWERWLPTAYLDTIASPPVWTQDPERLQRAAEYLR